MQETMRECEYKGSASEEWPRTERLLDCSKPVLNYRGFWTPLEAPTERRGSAMFLLPQPGIIPRYLFMLSYPVIVSGCRTAVCLVWWAHGFVKDMVWGNSTCPILVRGNGILVY